MTFAVAAAIAVSYWGARDMPPTCNPQPYPISQAAMSVFDGQDGVQAVARAEQGTCRVLIAPRLAVIRRRDPVWYCTIIVHEIGHLHGLSHAYGGVMSPELSHIPAACKRAVYRSRRDSA